MNLITFENYTIDIAPEALLVAPIRKLYNQDKTKNKETFIQSMSILFFMVDPRSNYNYIVDEDERLQEILSQEGLPKNYKISSDLKEAMETYKKLIKTPSSELLEDTLIALDRIRSFLRNIDLTLTDDKGKPVYTINSVTSAIKQIPQLAKDIVETQRIITKEIEEQGRARGVSSKKLFEDGITL